MRFCLLHSYDRGHRATDGRNFPSAQGDIEADDTFPGSQEHSQSSSTNADRRLSAAAGTMSRGGGGAHSSDKRDREARKARKKRDKAERRMERRERGPGEVEIVTAEEVLGVIPSVAEAMHDMEIRASSPTAAHAIPCRLFVGGLSWDTTADSLRVAFGEYGEISDSSVVTDRDSGRSRGFGFVTFADRKDAARAIKSLDGSELDGRRIVVNVATERAR